MKTLPANLTRIFEVGHEFPCPLCNKASNVYLPVYSKFVRDALLVVDVSDKRAAPDLEKLLAFIGNVKSETRCFNDLDWFRSYSEARGDLNLKIEELAGTKAMIHGYNLALSTFTAFKTHALGPEFSDSIGQTGWIAKYLGSWREWLMAANVISFASFIKNFGSSMDSHYITLRLIVQNELVKDETTCQMVFAQASARALSAALEDDSKLRSLSIEAIFCYLSCQLVDCLN